MKITDIRVIVTYPGRNYVFVKIMTDVPGLYGVGEGTLNGSEPIVAEALRHITPLLLGRDPQRIEDLWHLIYRQGYWRGGPIFMAALAAIDLALWDIKGKQAGLPVYQLLGGKARDGVMCYTHASGRDPVECEDSARKFIEQGFKVVRCQMGVYGGAGVLGMNPPLTAGTPGEQIYEPTPNLLAIPKLFAHLRDKLGMEIELFHDAHEQLPDSGSSVGERSRTLPPVLSGRPPDAGASGIVASASGGIGNTARDWGDIYLPLGLPAALYEPVDRLYPHQAAACRRNHRSKEDHDPGGTVQRSERIPRCGGYRTGGTGGKCGGAVRDSEFRGTGVDTLLRQNAGSGFWHLPNGKRLCVSQRSAGVRCGDRRGQSRAIPVSACLYATGAPRRWHDACLLTLPGFRGFTTTIDVLWELWQCPLVTPSCPCQHYQPSLSVVACLRHNLSSLVYGKGIL